MRRLGGGTFSVVAVALFAAALLPGIAGAKLDPRPNLTVARGAVRGVDGMLKGSFVVSNKGAAKAAESSAALIVKASRKNRKAGGFRVGSLDASGSKKVEVKVPLPSGLPAGTLPIRACADTLDKVRESSEDDNCHKVGTVVVAAPTPVSTGSTGAAGPAGPPTPSTVPIDPIPFTSGTPFEVKGSGIAYWADVPKSYDPTHATPATLFVWLHGCEGSASGDIYMVSPGGAQDWISVAVGGREGTCWEPDADQAKVLAAIADAKTHFNIDPHRVILGGYSSGGDLAYRTGFYNSSSFAGLLIVNSSPFRDTGSSQSDSLAAASTKFHVVHLAHLQDTTYPIAGVRKETDAMTAAGFPLTRVEVDGGHYDEAGEMENGHAVPGTSADIATYLLPHIDDGWRAP